jgi:protein-tyrosine phosphatase
MRLLFVCLGNICRSPTAEGVMVHRVRERGLEDEVELDSAGTGGWHVGAAPDERSASAASARGIKLSGSARRVEPGDFGRFDLVLAMDSENYAEIERLAPNEEARGKLRMLREFDPEAVAAGDLDVPDPYYGGPEGFDDVIDLVTRACEGLLEQIVQRRAA